LTEFCSYRGLAPVIRTVGTNLAGRQVSDHDVLARTTKYSADAPGSFLRHVVLLVTPQAHQGAFSPASWWSFPPGSDNPFARHAYVRVLGRAPCRPLPGTGLGDGRFGRWIL